MTEVKCEPIPADLARQLSSWLAQVVPEGFSVRSEGGQVLISAGSGTPPGVTDISWLLGSSDADPVERLSAVRRAVERVLSDVQDYIAETRAERWPSGDSPETLPSAYADVSALRISAGYAETEIVKTLDIVFASGSDQ